ncbi:hypothetical protein ONE63_011414 [Megalurothrips usitatus]|uniref:Uncharacterized protein n=1 Tax=Megalurothrips usitatus TaxID=439358 RepID=A0AAV7X1V8_9NEOP|nr:hypothetical protein ONE63_011414 [Megalurothrips usitatus]
MWYTIYSRKDNSHSLIEHSDIVKADGAVLERGGEVKFFYKNKPYLGVIEDLDEDREVLNLKLSKRGVGAMKQSKAGPGDPSPAVLLGKRTRETTVKFIAGSSTSSQRRKKAELSTEEQTRMRIRDKNLQLATRKGNEKVLDWLKESKTTKDSDPDFNPGQERAGSGSSDEDEDESALVASSVQRQEQRRTLVRGLKGIEPIQGQSSSHTLSNEEILKKKIQELEIKLQLAYDRSDEPERKNEKVEFADLCEQGENASSLAEPGLEFNDVSLKDDDDDSVVKEIENNKSLDEISVKESPISKPKSAPMVHEQLIGNGPGMMYLGKGVYCKSDVLDYAYKAGSVPCFVKRALTGVYKPETLDTVTLTGQAWRAGGQKGVKQALHRESLNVIIDSKCLWQEQNEVFLADS